MRARGESAGRVVRRRDVRGLLLTERTHPARQEVGRHRHESASLCLVVAGAYEESGVACRPGTLIVQPAGGSHDNRIGPTGARDLAIEPSREWLAGLDGLSRVLDGPLVVAGGDAARLAQRLWAETQHGDDVSALAVEALVLELVVALARREQPAAPAWLGRVLERLADAPAEPIDLAALARLAGVHRAHLARAFRRHVGHSIGEHLRRRRVDAACAALRETATPIATIALACGFCDQSHLDRVFKRLLAVTPRDYRRLHRRPA